MQQTNNGFSATTIKLPLIEEDKGGGGGVNDPLIPVGLNLLSRFSRHTLKENEQLYSMYYLGVLG